MATHTTIQISITIRKDFFQGIRDVGFDIAYWARVDAFNMLIEDETGTGYGPLDDAMIHRGIESILSGETKVNTAIVGNILRAVSESEPGHLDGTDTDCIIQAACFRDIVYG